MQATKQINILDLKAGMIVRFHGARFEITSTKIVDHNTAGAITDTTAERDIVMVANGRWIDGAVVPGYFGPNKDWNFQGNKYAMETVEI